MRRVVTIAIATAIAVLLFPRNAAAQAWLPPRGEGEVSLLYQNLYTRDHYDGSGSHVDRGRVRLLGVIQTTDFGVTDRIAITASLPFGMGRYTGAFPHQLPIDNGHYHGGMQDIGVGFRFGWRMHPVAITPFVFATIPSHEYEHFAHSAIGMNTKEVRIGVNFGQQFERLLPGAYYQGQYSYGISEATLGFRPNKSRVNTEFGYAITRKLSVRALAMAQVTDSGLDFEDYPRSTQTSSNPYWRNHDRIMAIDVLNIGGGIGYSINHQWDVFSSMLTSVWGENGHALKMGLSVGVSRSFTTPLARHHHSLEVADEGQVNHAEWRSKMVPQTHSH